MLGYTREELLRLNVKDLIPAKDLAAAPIRFDELQAGKTLLIERWLRRKDGTLLPVEISGRMIQDGVLQSIIRDISERKQAEEKLHKAYDELERRVTERTAELARANGTLTAEIAERRRAEETLRENEHRLKIALQTGKLGSWQLDLNTLELDSSEICKANFGLSEDADFSYQDLFAAIHPEDRARVGEAVKLAVADRSDYHAEYRVVWPDGSTHWIIARGRGIYEPGGESQRMIGVTVDITERRQAEDTRKELLRRLVTAQEDERRRISRELHDQMGQRLTALMMGLKMLDEESYGRRPALASLQRLQQITDELSREAHTLAWRLRPAALDDLGLHTALSNYVKDWAERSRVAVDFYSAGVEHARLPLAHETALYRITQEALTNVLKHSRADRVSIILERRADHVLAVVEDNGDGFDVDALTTLSPNERNLGLLGMRERATLLGGTLEVESAPGVGTSVFVRIPLGAGSEEGRDSDG
jgi:PAS domain S-box-containing protein